MAEKAKKLAKGFALPKPAARSDVKEGAAERFLRSERKSNRSSSSRLRREVGGERLAIYLPPDLAEALRVRCARERRSMSDAITDAVAEWMKRYSAT